MTDELLTVEVRPNGGAVVLAVSGELDLATCGTLQACIDALDPGFRKVELDFTDLTFIDSSGVGLISVIHRQFDPELRELTLRCPEGMVRRLLSISGIEQTIKIIDG